MQQQPHSIAVPSEVATALVSQFNFERYSADVYYAMAGALDTLNLVGFASYMKKRADEERSHAEKFRSYMADRNVLPKIDALPAIGTPAGTLMEIGEASFAAALTHEYKVTERIWSLCDVSEAAGDKATCEFLLWFIHEQVEEVKSLEEWLTRFELARGNGAAILDLDRELR